MGRVDGEAGARRVTPCSVGEHAETDPSDWADAESSETVRATDRSHTRTLCEAHIALRKSE